MSDRFALVDTRKDDAVRNMERQIDGVDCIYFAAIKNTANIREF